MDSKTSATNYFQRHVRSRLIATYRAVKRPTMIAGRIFRHSCADKVRGFSHGV
jgi:hypothetical protein